MEEVELLVEIVFEAAPPRLKDFLLAGSVLLDTAFGAGIDEPGGLFRDTVLVLVGDRIFEAVVEDDTLLELLVIERGISGA